MSFIQKVIKRLFEKGMIIPSLILRDLVPKKKGLVIFQSNSLNRYCENTRYLYEYALTRDELEIYWDTNKKEVYDYLTEKGSKVFWHYSFQSWCLYLRAQVVVGTGSAVPNFARAVGSKTIKYNMFHGACPKSVIPTFEKLKDTLDEIYKMQHFDFINMTSLFSRVMMGQLVLKVHSKRLVINGYPRCDHLFDEKKVKEMHQTKAISKSFFPDITDKSKVLLYAPTHGGLVMENQVPLLMYEDFDKEKLVKFLSDNDMYLLLSAHPHGADMSELTDDRIKFIDTEKRPLFDMNLLLPEIDFLFGDYSSIHVEFSILKRPMAYVLTNYDEYFSTHGFIDSFKENLPGPEAESFEHLLLLIKMGLTQPPDYSGQRKKLLEKYYDVNITNACERNYQFIKECCS